MAHASLTEYKNRVDLAIESYCRELLATTKQNFGSEAKLVASEFCKFLARGGKRIRGSLVIFSYQASGGKDNQAINQVALAVELMHAYILAIDDIQDKSELRRGELTLHKKFEHIAKNREINDSQQFGLSLALNAALVGSHEANRIMLEQDFIPKDLLLAVKELNSVMVSTSHGQTLDIINQSTNEPVSEEDVSTVHELKTAHYTIYCPLVIGMILAGKADQAKLLSNFALHLGKLFQITDDIIGVFGSKQTGKNNLDDIKEGKATLLSAYTINNLANGQKNRFLELLGKPNITQEEFIEARDLIQQSGSLEYSRQLAKKEHDEAIKSLHELKVIWSKDDIDFLIALTGQILSRQA